RLDGFEQGDRLLVAAIELEDAAMDAAEVETGGFGGGAGLAVIADAGALLPLGIPERRFGVGQAATHVDVADDHVDEVAFDGGRGVIEGVVLPGGFAKEICVLAAGEEGLGIEAGAVGVPAGGGSA